jgi:peptidoglycan/xylan/chitin deacetylase (PgdA/CDA1 family)
MYHHIHPVTDENESAFVVDPDVFRQQMDGLIDGKFHIVSLDEVETAYRQKRQFPPSSVLITFDDGWADNYTHAFPIIAEKKIPVTIFLSTALTGTEKDLLTWEQVRRMQASGRVRFASHGAHHKRLRDLSDDEAMEELTASRNKLKKELGVEALSFCYPYGAFDRRIRRLVFKAGYIIDFGTRKGINRCCWNARQPVKRKHVMNHQLQVMA